YLQLARLDDESGKIEARDCVDKIEDTDLRKNARAFIDASRMIRATDKKDSERILQIVKTCELTHLQKCWALTQATQLLAKTDRDESLATLHEASAEARRVEAVDPDRPRAL